MCNEARLHQEGEAWQLEGDPTEGALLSLGLKLGLDPQALAAERPRSDAIPFESEHRFMATLHHDHAGQAMVYLKGAPERILDMCEAERVGDSVRPLDPDYWRRLATDTAARGLRLLAIARRAMPAEQRTLDFADVEHGFTLLALVGIIDPPREEAVAAVAECQAAGIAVKMITGDHVDTARAIGAMLGIGIDRPALTGAEIELLDDQRLREVLPGVDVFARASPEHKLRLVQALQASGEVVAMTGDGVNDAPALKRADVGVAMGNKGTEAAKEAAEVVLADDNFATIANAVREGGLRQPEEIHPLHAADQRWRGADRDRRDPVPVDPADDAGADPLDQHGHLQHPGPGAGLRSGRARPDAASAASAGGACCRCSSSGGCCWSRC